MRCARITRTVVTAMLASLCVGSSTLATRQGAQSAPEVVTITGHVKQPGKYPFVNGMTVAMVIERAGGISSGVLRQIWVSRLRGVAAADGTPNVSSVVATKDTVLLAGDVIVVDAYETDHVPMSASRVVDWLANGQFDLVMVAFDEKMRLSKPEDKLRGEWQSAEKQFGTFQRQVDVRIEADGVKRTGIVTCEFARGRVEVSVTFNLDGQVVGLSLMPVEP